MRKLLLILIFHSFFYAIISHKGFKMKHFISSITLLLLLNACSSHNPPKAPIHSSEGDYTYVKEYMNWYIKEQMEEHNIVGLSVALVDDQKIVWQEGFGYADRKNNLKATANTRYWAGSITKLFTGMGVMKLVEEGKMDIDKPFKTYLPEFSIKSRFGSTDDITPRTIMTHHSGLPGDWVDGMFSLHPTNYTEYVKLIKNEYTAYPPNKIMSYSNLGVTLLGHALEKTAGVSYTSYIEDKLFKPLAMTHSDFKMDMSNGSKSYMDNEETTEYPIGEIPAGALGTTVGDLSHLAMMVNANGRFNNKEVLKTTTLQKMFKIQNRNIELDMGRKIGLSWFIDDKTLGKNNIVYGHGGATTAHRSMFSVAPKSKLAVVILTNSAEATSSNIAKTMLQKAYEAKTGKKIPKDTVENKNVKKGSGFEGTYASRLGELQGVVKIEKKSEDYYVGHSTNENFSLKKNDKNEYKGKYLLWSFIPLSDDDLNKVKFYTQTIDGEELIMLDMNQSRLIAGVKVVPKPINEAYKKYLGTYEIINQLEPKNLQIKQVIAKIEDAFPILEIEMKSGEKMVEILRVVNDHEAIVEGLGRSKRETLYLKNGIFHYQGLKFRKVSDDI